MLPWAGGECRSIALVKGCLICKSKPQPLIVTEHRADASSAACGAKTRAGRVSGTGQPSTRPFSMASELPPFRGLSVALSVAAGGSPGSNIDGSIAYWPPRDDCENELGLAPSVCAGLAETPVPIRSRGGRAGETPEGRIGGDWRSVPSPSTLSLGPPSLSFIALAIVSAIIVGIVDQPNTEAKETLQGVLHALKNAIAHQN